MMFDCNDYRNGQSQGCFEQWKPNRPLGAERETMDEYEKLTINEARKLLGWQPIERTADI